jgi:hypothetical protein
MEPLCPPCSLSKRARVIQCVDLKCKVGENFEVIYYKVINFCQEELYNQVIFLNVRVLKNTSN